MKRILKWNVPIDDKSHPIGAGPVVHVAIQGDDTVLELQVWTEEPAEGEPRTVLARVYGTGHEYPDEGFALGSVFGHGGLFVWHLVSFPGWS